VSVPGPHVSVMTGLNCGTPSYVAWPYLRDGLDAVVAIEDEAAMSCVRALGDAGVAVGACAGAGLAAAQALLSGPGSAAHRARLGIRPDSSVLVFATEGVTDGHDDGG
jgi:diaminopropionate ammonia-lyase